MTSRPDRSGGRPARRRARSRSAHRRSVRARRRRGRRRPARGRPDRARRAARDGGRRGGVRASSTCPVYAVLGNHDHHANQRRASSRAILEDAGVVVLERSWADGVDQRTRRSGSPGRRASSAASRAARCPDFGEPLLREVYAETGKDVAALDRALAEIADCPLRVVLLHYSPTMSTLVGEPESIWTYLGTNRLDGPIQKHRPDLVLHGHAHEGTFAGASARCPCTTWRCTSCAATSSSSSSTPMPPTATARGSRRPCEDRLAALGRAGEGDGARASGGDLPRALRRRRRTGASSSWTSDGRRYGQIRNGTLVRIAARVRRGDAAR